MKRKRHSEKQIIAILNEHEAGLKTADLCGKHGISEASFYNWKAKDGGLEVSEAKRLKGLQSASPPSIFKSSSGGLPLQLSLINGELHHIRSSRAAASSKGSRRRPS